MVSQLGGGWRTDRNSMLQKVPGTGVLVRVDGQSLKVGAEFWVENQRDYRGRRICESFSVRGPHSRGYNATTTET